MVAARSWACAKSTPPSRREAVTRVGVATWTSAARRAAEVAAPACRRSLTKPRPDDIAEKSSRACALSASDQLPHQSLEGNRDSGLAIHRRPPSDDTIRDVKDHVRRCTHGPNRNAPPKA